MNYQQENQEKYLSKFWIKDRNDEKYFSNYVKKEIISEWLGCGVKYRLLDAGGGTGNWSWVFRDHFENITVYDISEAALNQVDSHVKFEAVQGSLLDINLKERFNTVLMIDVLEHLETKDLDKCLQEIHKVMFEGSELIVFTSLKSWRTFGYNLTKADIIDGHLNRLTWKELISLFECNGFEIIDYKNYSILFQPLTDYLKDKFCRLFSFVPEEEEIRRGQSVKENYKKNLSKATYNIPINLLSKISYLDIFLGRFIKGKSIFIKLRRI